MNEAAGWESSSTRSLLQVPRPATAGGGMTSPSNDRISPKYVDLTSLSLFAFVMA